MATGNEKIATASLNFEVPDFEAFLAMVITLFFE